MPTPRTRFDVWFWARVLVVVTVLVPVIGIVCLVLVAQVLDTLP